MASVRSLCKARVALRGCAGAWLPLVALSVMLFASPPVAVGQQVNPQYYSGMQWRLIGPFRGGRVTAVAGIPGNPAVYYMGTPGGGVWKTTDGGDVWKPIFDSVPVASIGALALAPSNPEIIYVGTGEQTDGQGVFKSTDGGATWSHAGLEETRVITAVLVDARNPDVVLVGARGAFGEAGAARGVFRSMDGGKSWTKVLFKDDRTGVMDMCSDPGDRRVVYVALEHFAGGAGGPGQQQRGTREQDSWIYKSTDGGATWKPVSEQGLPTEPRGRIGVAVAAGNRGQRVFAIMAQGLFRSDDAGATWRQITKDPRVVGSGYFGRVFADPKNAQNVYVVQTSLYRSQDGGETFISFKGAPGGDDYHVMWLDPENSQRMILGVDQGATVSLDGGRSWSTWFNQPTGQFYNVVTDNQFPYHVYAEQQDSGTAAVPSRSDYGEISYREWFSVGGFEFGYIAPDPLHPNIVFTAGWYRTVLRYDKTTGGIHVAFTPGLKYRSANEAPLVFSPLHPETLYYATQFVLKTTDGGESWQTVSPDLTVPPPDEKKKEGEAPAGPLGQRTITALALSSVNADVIWAGTNQGWIQATDNGGANWRNVTPADLPPRAHVRILEASHFDAAAAYVAEFANDDSHPYFYRTRDGGKSWQKIVAGLPDWGIARTIREDPFRRGLLYAGTQNAVFVSFDDGDHWQSLQLNLPTATVRDLAVHGDDLIAATYGRSLWILDDILPLREVGVEAPAAAVHLYQPAKAWRMRWDNDQETPLPPEFPAAPNPPDGAIIDYYLKDAPAGDISLEIRDEKGNLVRRFTSEAAAGENLPYNVPEYWFGAPAALPKKAGMNRFVWDLRYPSPASLPFSYYGSKLDYVEMTMVDNAVAGKTPRHQPVGALVVPGRYELRLQVGANLERRWLTVEMDPRIKATHSDLEEQLGLAQQLGAGMSSTQSFYNSVTALRAAIADRQKSLPGGGKAKSATSVSSSLTTINAGNMPETDEKDLQEESADVSDSELRAGESSEAPEVRGAARAPKDEAADALASLDKEAEKLETGTNAEPGFGSLNRDMSRLFAMVEAGDLRPSDSVHASAAELCAAQQKAVTRWQKLNAESLPAANRLLEQQHLPVLAVAASTPPVSCAATP